MLLPKCTANGRTMQDSSDRAALALAILVFGGPLWTAQFVPRLLRVEVTGNGVDVLLADAGADHFTKTRGDTVG